jgi:hypothetical protein
MFDEREIMLGFVENWKKQWENEIPKISDRCVVVVGCVDEGEFRRLVTI